MRDLNLYVDFSFESHFMFRLRDHSAMIKVVAVLDYEFLFYLFMFWRDSSMWAQCLSMKFLFARIIFFLIVAGLMIVFECFIKSLDFLSCEQLLSGL